MKRVRKYLGNKAISACALVIMVLCGIGSSAFATESEAASGSLFREITTLDPQWESNRVTLIELTDHAASAEKKQSKSEKKLARDSGELENLPIGELKKVFIEDDAKRDARAYAAIERLAREASPANDATNRIVQIREIQAGLRNSTVPSVPEKLGIFTSWIFFFKNISGSITRGRTPAANLTAPLPPGGDRGRIDPAPSTFWSRPKAIAEEDLYGGFGRSAFPRLEDALCDYSAPKTSSGTHGGFDVEFNGERYKIKFGDLNSEPFTARIFYALGFHADPTDFAAQVKVRYHRRLLREFHLRKPLTMKITPLGIPVATMQLQPHYDPFAFITSAVFKDGRQVSGAALKQMLFKNPTLSHPEYSPQNFLTNVEAELDYLVTTPANIQPRDGPTQSIGSWDFGQLGHENLRELRGAGLLAAWLGWFDSRTDNTKLRLLRDAEGVQLLHFFSDLGGGMGSGTGLFSPQGENPNQFTWTFTSPEIVRGPGRMTTPFRIRHFKPTVPTPAFAAMTADDARWMARLIGQLTENQLRAALIASGYDNAEARLYLEKLINRRDRMIVDLGLRQEIPLLRPIPAEHNLSYYPQQADAAFTAKVNGEMVYARKSESVIKRGELTHP